MRERTRLDQQLSAVREIERELADNMAMIELGEAEGEQSIVAEARGQAQRRARYRCQEGAGSLLSGEADATTTASWK